MSEKSKSRVSRFYLTCAFSTSIIAAVNLYISDGSWFSGFTVGFSIASVLALLFLAAQTRALGSRGVDTNV